MGSTRTVVALWIKDYLTVPKIEKVGFRRASFVRLYRSLELLLSWHSKLSHLVRVGCFFFFCGNKQPQVSLVYFLTMLMSLASQQEVITHPTYSRNCNDKPTIVSYLAGHWASRGWGEGRPGASYKSGWVWEGITSVLETLWTEAFDSHQRGHILGRKNHIH